MYRDHSNRKMAARPSKRCSVKEKGFYKRLNMGDKRERLEDVEVLSEKNSDGVYEVERFVEKKMKKVRLCGPLASTLLAYYPQSSEFLTILFCGKIIPEKKLHGFLHQTLHLKQSGLYHYDCYDMAELHTDCTMIHSHQLEQC